MSKKIDILDDLFINGKGKLILWDQEIKGIQEFRVKGHFGTEHILYLYTLNN